MPRKKCLRHIDLNPNVTYYKPSGIPLKMLSEIIIHLDELEAIRLADYEGKYQEKAAESMKVSRQTFGRIVESAHKKISDALINGKAIRIEGGNIKLKGNNKNATFKPYRA